MNKNFPSLHVSGVGWPSHRPELIFLAYGAGAIRITAAGFIKTPTGSSIGGFPFVLVLAVAGIIIAFAPVETTKTNNLIFTLRATIIPAI